MAADGRRGEEPIAKLANVLGYVQARGWLRPAQVPLGRTAVDADGLIADETTAHAITGAIATVLSAVDAVDTSVAVADGVLWAACHC